MKFLIFLLLSVSLTAFSQVPVGSYSLPRKTSDGFEQKIMPSTSSTVWTNDSAGNPVAKPVADFVLDSDAIAWSALTGTPTTLSGYGITDAQPSLNLSANQFYARSSSGAAGVKTITDPALGLLASTAFDFSSDAMWLVTSGGTAQMSPSNGFTHWDDEGGNRVTLDTEGLKMYSSTGQALTLALDRAFGSNYVVNLQAKDGTVAYIDDVPSQTVDVQTFTTSGTWTKPAGAVYCEVLVIGGGGGGGSGALATSEASHGVGGGGGGAGAFVSVTLDAGVFGATEAVTVGAGGLGGPAPVSPGAGTAGTNGAPSSVGDVVAVGGNGGAGGPNSGHNAVGGASQTGRNFIAHTGVNTASLFNSGPGGNGVYNGNGATPTILNAIVPTGGGGGGYAGFSSNFSGGAGGGYSVAYIPALGGLLKQGGILGDKSNDALTPGANGGDGLSVFGRIGTGGGGGGAGYHAISPTNGGNGGNGGLYGGGGGGGGGGILSVTPGKGGDGGAGLVIITTYINH